MPSLALTQNSQSQPLFQNLRKIISPGPLKPKPLPPPPFKPPSPGPQPPPGPAPDPTLPPEEPTPVDPGVGTTPPEIPVDPGTPPGGAGPPIFGEQDENLNPYAMPSLVNPFLAPFLTRMALQGLLGNLGQRAKRRLPTPSFNPYNG